MKDSCHLKQTNYVGKNKGKKKRIMLTLLWQCKFKNKWLQRLIIIKMDVLICLFGPSDDDFLSLGNKLGKENMTKMNLINLADFSEYRKKGRKKMQV